MGERKEGGIDGRERAGGRGGEGWEGREERRGRGEEKKAEIEREGETGREEAEREIGSDSNIPGYTHVHVLVSWRG